MFFGDVERHNAVDAIRRPLRARPHEHHPPHDRLPPCPSPVSFADRRITGILLAGGQGNCHGRCGQGPGRLAGRPMAAHARAPRPPADALPSTPTRTFRSGGPSAIRVFGDDIGGFAGPLAGLHAGLLRAQHPFVVVTRACDSPFLPAGPGERPAAALHGADAQLAVAERPSGSLHLRVDSALCRAPGFLPITLGCLPSHSPTGP